MRRKNVTMQDIADYLSISKVTVSKALNGKEGVSQELREKIIEVGRTMHYKMPGHGKESASQSRHIAIFMKEKFAEGEAGFYLKFYQKISMELTRQGYFAHLFPVSHHHGQEGGLSQLLERYDISGILLLGELREEFLEKVEGGPVPCIMVDTYMPSSCGQDWQMDCVITEGVYSMCQLTQHLMECGHRDIGFVGTMSATNSIKDRYLGYVKAHLEKGIPIRGEWILGDRNLDSEAVEFTLPETMPTAFVCNCDDTAYQFVRLLLDRGYRVPEDISIVSFDNDIYAELCVPKLTTAAVNIGLMAEKSVDLIIQKIQQEGVRPQGVIFVNPTIIYRDSVKVLNEKEEQA